MTRPLTTKERRVAQLLAAAETRKDIAAELKVSLRRVDALIAQIARCLGLPGGKSHSVQIAIWWWSSQH